MSKKIKKEDIIKDVQKVAKKYRKEFPDNTGYLTRDYYRKYGKYTEAEYTGFFDTFTKLKNIAVNEDNETDIDNIKLQKDIFRLNDKVSILEKEKKELMKASCNSEDILEIYENSLNNKDFDYKIDNTIHKDNTEKDGVLQISDIHLGEVVKYEDVGGANEFNKDVALQRLDKVFNDSIEKCIKNKVRNFYILFNGDLLSGSIHDELARTNDLNEVEAVFLLQEYLVEKLTEISKHFNKIEVTFIVGNHSRILQGRPYFKEKVKMNWEYVLGRQLKSLFARIENNNKIIIDVPESAFVIKDINGSKFLVTHGDILSGGGGGFAGLPFYGLAMSSAKFYGVLKQIGVGEQITFDNILIGHLHTTAKMPIFTGGFLYINGCICGTNEFSIFKMKSVAKIEQTLLLINLEGKIVEEYTIRGK